MPRLFELIDRVKNRAKSCENRENNIPFRSIPQQILHGILKQKPLCRILQKELDDIRINNFRCISAPLEVKMIEFTAIYLLNMEICRTGEFCDKLFHVNRSGHSIHR